MTRNQELIEEAKKRGYTHNNFKCLKDLKHTSNPDLNKWYYEGCTDTLFSNSCGNGGKVVYKEGVWAEMIKPIETFTPVAMKCTQEQFDAVKPKLRELKIEELSSFENCMYLTNLFRGKENVIGNIASSYVFERTVHEEWNEEIFLKACGIEVETTEQKELLNNKNMVDLTGYSVLVDNEEQARKLQEIAFEQGFKWVASVEDIVHLGAESFQFGYGGEKVITYNYDKRHYQDKFITKKAHFNDLFKKETLQEKAIRLENELKEVKRQIEEENKPKVGDWVYSTSSLCFYEKELTRYQPHERKITNLELIKLLEQEMY